MRKKFLAIMSLFIFTLSVQANQPPSKEQIASYKKDGSLERRISQAKNYGTFKFNRGLVVKAQRRLQQLSQNSETLSHQIPQGADNDQESLLPSIGSPKMLVLLVEFADYQHNDEINSRASVASKIFGQGNENDFPYESQANFYKRSSYGKLNIQGDVLDWYKTDYDRPMDSQNSGADVNLIIKDAIEHHDALGHDFSQYDNNGDGSIDYVAVIWTGPTGEWASLWWGSFSFFWDDTFVVDGKTISTFSWQQISYSVDEGPFSPETLIHETGHALGLADYYDYDDSVGPGGGLGLMDQMAGSHDHNTFSKYLLGWLTPTIVNSGQSDINLSPSSASEDALLIMKDANSETMFSEFFMIQYRDKANNDIDLPGEGLIIWHIDATLDNYGSFKNDNSYTDSKLIRLVQADGLEEIEKGDGVADKGDFFNTGQSFSQNGIPNSKNNDGLHTGVVIKNIEENTNNIGFNAEIYPRLVDFTIPSISDHQIVRSIDAVDVDIPDNSYVDKVEFFIDDILAHTYIEVPYQFSLSQSVLSIGMHQFKVKVTNNDGRVSVESRDIVFLNEQSSALVVSIDNNNDEELLDMLAKQGMNTVSSHFIIPLSTDDFHLVHLNYGSTYGPEEEPEEEPGVFSFIANFVEEADIVNIKNYLEQGGRLIIEGESILTYTSSLRNFLGVEVIEGFVLISSVNGTGVYDNNDVNVDQSNRDVPIYADIFKSTDTTADNILSTSGSYYDFYAEQDIDIIGTCALNKTVPGTELKVVISSCLTRNIDRYQKSLVYNNYLQFLGFDKRISSNHAPLVNVGDDQTVIEGSEVSLSATISDEDQDNLTFGWQQTAGATVILTNDDSLSPSFTAPNVNANTVFTFALSVSDGEDSTSTSVSINVTNIVDATEPEIAQNKSGSFSLYLLLLSLISIVIKNKGIMKNYRDDRA